MLSGLKSPGWVTKDDFVVIIVTVDMIIVIIPYESEYVILVVLPVLSFGHRFNRVN